MNFIKTYVARLAWTAALGALGAAFALPAGAQSITLSGTTSNSCNFSGAMNVSPNGAITVTCSNASTPPACTISGSTSVSSGGNIGLTANCSPAATSYSWTGNTAGFVSPNSSTLTISAPADGSYSFTVTGTNAAGTGATSASYSVTVAPPQAAPVCTISGANSVVTGGNINLTATCNPSATSYTWTGTTAGFVSPNSSALTITAPADGTYQFTVAGTNSFGAGTASGPYSVTVAPAQTGTCPTTPGNVVGPAAGYTTLGNLRFDLKAGSGTFGQLGSQVLDWPNGSTGNMRLSVQKGTSIESPAGEVIQVSISPCPGQFTETSNPGCNAYKTSGYINIGAGTTCPLAPGRYYINVRNSSPTGVNTCGSPTNTPAYGYCTSYVKATNY